MTISLKGTVSVSVTSLIVVVNTAVRGRVNRINNRSDTKNGRAVSQTLVPDLQ